MTLRLVGIDPDSEQGESPTVWVDPEQQEFYVQGWRTSAADEARCYAAGDVPGHATGVPAHEAIVRVPARMAQILREACDVLERPADH